MDAYIFKNPVTLMFGAENEEAFLQALKQYGSRVLVIYDISFEANGFLKPLTGHMEALGMTLTQVESPVFPSLNFVRKQIQFCRENGIDSILGIGGGTAMDVSKTTAFGVKQAEDVLTYLNYSTPYDGSVHLPVALIATVPCSGSEMDDATQITVDETGEQYGLSTMYGNLAWLNPAYVMTLPDEILARSVMTSFVHTATTFLGIRKSQLAENISITFMNMIRENLQRVLSGNRDEETIGDLMTASAMHLSGLTAIGKTMDMAIYYLNGFVQTAAGIPYTRAITTLFPYWLRDCYHGQEVFKDFFNRVLGVSKSQSDAEILHQALEALRELYHGFGVPFSCREIPNAKIDTAFLHDALVQLGTIESQYGALTPEQNEKMILDCVEGRIFG